MKRDCPLCLGPCDAEIHAATLSLHRWFKRRIVNSMAPVVIGAKKLNVSPHTVPQLRSQS